MRHSGPIERRVLAVVQVFWRTKSNLAELVPPLRLQVDVCRVNGRDVAANQRIVAHFLPVVVPLSAVAPKAE
jgi:hypothetical protein